MNRTVPFDFSDECPEDSGSYVAVLPAALTNRDQLFRELFVRLRLPQYFGFNWDALSDCLRDLHWLESGRVFLVHTDVPALPLDERCTYLEVLAEAVDSWRPGNDHDFRAVFPTMAFAQISAALAK